ncbi:MAG: histidine kinase, partial [Flavobacteriales bacterium]|nr:histidine kinase [Flavobacteriales bacterium]
QKLAETEMMALRAQMNPHFLFNCLNSIKFFIINNETDKASDYLGKFGRLIRLILQNSEETLITLDLELEALQLYVDLESLRFENKFQFILKVENSVSPEMIEIPPLIIQPFVENAIWHGLMHAHRQGKLLINISMQNDELLCIIEDNGVGRAEAGRLKSKSVMKKKSMGLDITKNRLKLINPDAQNINSVSMEDLFDQDGNASGTRVSLRIPI